MAVMPVVREEFDAYFKLVHINDVHYPVAEFTSLIGFFLILFLEELMSYCSRRQNGNPVLYLDDVTHEEESSSRAGLLTPDDEPHDAFEELKLEDGSLNTSCHQSHGHSHAHSHAQLMDTSGFSFFVLMFATRYDVNSLIEWRD